MAQDIQNAVIAVLIENESGALARVVGLFSGRGYNIESLTVSAVDAERKLSRITVVTSGTEMVIAQIKAQLARLIPVHGVCDLTATGPHVAREMALVKVVSHGETRTEGMRIADAFRAHIVDTTSGSFVFELTGSTEKLDAFVELMRPLGLAEVSRTGIAAIGRGPQTFYSNQESF
ncbi:acetolactate synthase small subunit [Kozakia baliensis]|uniref:Acetolactate synthase small subunit n=1 Tax=Kozakia baliensis TaxID=153496 RepID=A0A1D8UWM1_9PROT|nr:acetolactate synthase small subunit [Kozakia baliensis]AOX17897.1 acetolactate synthase small subunit [Kozakia baliensis]GBR26512.1 acetolactate synthase 3 regulatory subunit [Kozakia baliensis NRIC 0488]GEL64341.1 acetolactate synthase small subunit [Kozakia baliensis]